MDNLMLFIKLNSSSETVQSAISFVEDSFHNNEVKCSPSQGHF